MRFSLLLFFFSVFLTTISAQRGRGPTLIGVWNETSLDRYGTPVRPEYQPNRNVLILDADGYFEEIRPGQSNYTTERRFLGRWIADYRTGDFNLLVDLPRRSPDGRFRYRDRVKRVPYSIVFSDRNELVLRDRRNGRKRIFVRSR